MKSRASQIQSSEFCPDFVKFVFSYFNITLISKFKINKNQDKILNKKKEVTIITNSTFEY